MFVRIQILTTQEHLEAFPPEASKCIDWEKDARVTSENLHHDNYASGEHAPYIFAKASCAGKEQQDEQLTNLPMM